MKFLKILLNILLSFILMLGIVGSTFLVIANQYTNKESMLKKFEEINLYHSVYEEVRNSFENYIYQSGLDINIIDKICTKEKVKNDILIVVNSMYGEGNSSIDSTEVRTNLDKAIKEYVESQGRKLSNEEEKNIQEFEDLIEEAYNEQIGLYQKGSDQIARRLPQVLDIIKKGEIIAVGLTALVLIGLVVVNTKKVSIAGSYAGVSVLSSGVIMILTKSMITSKLDVDELIIFTKSLSNAVINILNSILSSIQTFGVWYIVLGILIIVCMNAVALIDKKS